MAFVKLLNMPAHKVEKHTLHEPSLAEVAKGNERIPYFSSLACLQRLFLLYRVLSDLLSIMAPEGLSTFWCERFDLYWGRRDVSLAAFICRHRPFRGSHRCKTGSDSCPFSEGRHPTLHLSSYAGRSCVCVCGSMSPEKWLSESF